jgi:phage-related protein
VGDAGDLEPLAVRFFRTDNGNEPVREWLKDLTKEERTLIGADIKTVQFGWPIGMPTVKPMGSGLYEIRTNLDGKISRVLISVSNNVIHLLQGFIKKTQKTPLSDLKLARSRKKKID